MINGQATTVLLGADRGPDCHKLCVGRARGDVRDREEGTP